MPTPLEIAGSQLGVIEGPRNAQPYSLPHYPNQPWCAQFVSWCFRVAGQPLPEMQTSGVDGFAGCAIGLEYARKAGWVVTEPRPGDLVFFQFDSDSSPDHVGFLLNADAQKPMETIEGNAGEPGGVRQMRRDRASVIAFVRVGEH